VAACAFKIPQRLTAAAIVSGGGTFDMPQPIEGIPKSYLQMSWLARRIPWLHRLVVKILLPRQLLRDPDYSSLKATLPEVDRMALERPGGTQLLRESILEAVRCGTRGVATDYAILWRPWGFRLQDISIEVHLWHGESDKNVPPAMARYVASAIPSCQARFLPEEGHFSLAGNHIEEILTILTS